MIAAMEVVAEEMVEAGEAVPIAGAAAVEAQAIADIEEAAPPALSSFRASQAIHGRSEVLQTLKTENGTD